MFIEKIKNNGKDYLRLVHAVRKPNKNGDMVSSKKVLLNIGPLDRFDDGQPDYLERLKKSFKAGNPLIPSLIHTVLRKNQRKLITSLFRKAAPAVSGIRNSFHMCSSAGSWKNWD